MGMYNDFLDILKVMRNDETLLRLLYYQPEDIVNNIPNPLSPLLPDILKMDAKTRNEIRNNVIVKTSKVDNLETQQICRIYFYPGRRTSSGNFLFADQQVIFDVIVHETFEDGDLRSTRIADRLNDLFAIEHISGIGKMDHVDGYPINAPNKFLGFKHIFKIVGFKKDRIN